MSGSFSFKDPTKLPCPCCGAKVDAGATLGSLKRLAKRNLACSNCNTALLVQSQNYHSLLPCVLAMGAAEFLTLLDPWVWLVPLSGFLSSLYLYGKEIQSTHLVVRR